MRIVIVIGQATSPGRLANACRVLEETIQAAGSTIDTVDLSSTRLEICDGRGVEQYDATTQAAITTISQAAGVVIASPVYRASYPGVLKNLLDLLPVEALRDRPVGIVAMGASDHHYLAVDGHLRMVLAWFGAFTLPTSLYLTNRDFDADRQPTVEAQEELRALAQSVYVLAERTTGTVFGPTPLAARTR